MKAQASLEYMLLVAISLAIVGILWSVSTVNVQDAQWELQLAHAKNALYKVTQAADAMYAQGEPAQLYINVEFPSNVKAVYIINNSVTTELLWKNILRNLTYYSVTNLTGSLGTYQGTHKLLIRAGSPVSISEA